MDSLKSFALLLLLIGSEFCFAQDTIFMDADWKPTTRAKAEYFRVDKKELSLWTRTDYYKNKQLQMKGTYSSLAPEIEDGYFEWYHPNGKLKHKGNFKDGKSIGEHLWYYDNGYMEAKELYNDGKLNGLYEEYDEDGQLIIKSLFADGVLEGYEIPEAGMFLRLPNDEWSLSDHSGKQLVQYIFKRNEIIDSKGLAIIPAIMIYIEDASYYNQDLVLYSMQKRLQFTGKNIKIGKKILIPDDKDFPFPSFKNAMVIPASYTDNGTEHILYMVYIITMDNKGIQLYMDMTADIAKDYEEEFWITLRSIKNMIK